MSEYTDTSTPVLMILMCVFFFVLRISAMRIASVVARRFQLDSSDEVDEDDVSYPGPPLPPPDGVHLAIGSSDRESVYRRKGARAKNEC